MCGLFAAAMVVGTGLQIAGQQTAARAEQGVLQQQAKFDRFRAKDARKRGRRRAGLVSSRVDQVQAATEADFVGRGIDIDSGVVGDFAAEAEFFGQMEIDNILADAEREAFGFELAADNAIFQGDQARSAANINSFSTAFSAAGSAGLSWLEYRRYQGGQPATQATPLSFDTNNPFSSVRL